MDTRKCTSQQKAAILANVLAGMGYRTLATMPRVVTAERYRRPKERMPKASVNVNGNDHAAPVCEECNGTGIIETYPPHSADAYDGCGDPVVVNLPCHLCTVEGWRQHAEYLAEQLRKDREAAAALRLRQEESARLLREQQQRTASRARELLSARRKAKAKARRIESDARNRLTLPADSTAVVDNTPAAIVAPNVIKGIFPGHPLYHAYTAWLDGKGLKASKKTAREYYRLMGAGREEVV